MRMKARVAIAALMSGVLLAGCGQGGSSEGLRVTWWGSDNLNQSLQQVLGDFGKENGVTPKGEALAFDGYWDKLATQSAGKNLPDVLMQAASQLPDYASKGALADLSTAKGLDLTGIDETARDFGSVGDKQYGVVAAINAEGVIVNEEELAKTGVSYPEGEYSWAEFADFVKQVQAKLPEGTYALQDSSGDMIPFIYFVRDATGGDVYNDDGTLAATPEQLTQWFGFWQDLRDAGAVPPADVTAEAQGQIPTSPMVKGKAVMGFGWNQDFVTYQSLMKVPMAIQLPPYQESNPSLWVNAASLWSISAWSKNQDKAAELIDYMINDPAAIKTEGVALGVPPSQKARDELSGQISDADQQSVDYMSLVASKSRPLNRLWPAGFAEERTLMQQLSESIAFGKTTIDQAVTEFFATAQEFDAKQG